MLEFKWAARSKQQQQQRQEQHQRQQLQGLEPRSQVQAVKNLIMTRFCRFIERKSYCCDVIVLNSQQCMKQNIFNRKRATYFYREIPTFRIVNFA